MCEELSALTQDFLVASLRANTSCDERVGPGAGGSSRSAAIADRIIMTSSSRRRRTRWRSGSRRCRASRGTGEARNCTWRKSRSASLLFAVEPAVDREPHLPRRSAPSPERSGSYRRRRRPRGYGSRSACRRGCRRRRRRDGRTARSTRSPKPPSAHDDGAARRPLQPSAASK